jgi:putative transposase
MPAPHSEDLRSRFVAAYKAELGTIKQLAKTFGVGEATGQRWIKLDRQTGTVSAKPMGGFRHKKRTPEVDALLESLVKDEPNWASHELAEKVSEVLGIQVNRRTISKWLGELGMTFKRGSSGRSRRG